MYKVSFTKEAQGDFQRATDYVAHVLLNPTAAVHLADLVKKEADALGVFPNRFPLVRDELLASQGVRWTQILQYMLFYYVDEKQEHVFVLRFLSARQDWKNDRTLTQGFLPRS